MYIFMHSFRGEDQADPPIASGYKYIHYNIVYITIGYIPFPLPRKIKLVRKARLSCFFRGSVLE